MRNGGIAVKEWKPEAVVAMLSLLFAAFAGGYFLGTSRVSTLEPVVMTSRAAPSQEEALTAPGEEKPAAPEPESGDARIDINTASADELTTLPGIGETLAGRIVADREKNGPFSSVDELTRVDGVGEKKLEEISDLVTAGGSE